MKAIDECPNCEFEVSPERLEYVPASFRMVFNACNKNGSGFTSNPQPTELLASFRCPCCSARWSFSCVFRLGENVWQYEDSFGEAVDVHEFDDVPYDLPPKTNGVRNEGNV